MLNAGTVGLVSRHIHKILEPKSLREFPIVLEVGAGHGQHFEFVKHGFNHYFESDFRPDNLPNRENDSNLSNKKVTSIEANAEDLRNFNDSSVDRLIATCLIVHLNNPEAALREWRRVTRESGLISIYVASEPGLILRFLRTVTTVRKAKKLGVNHLSFHYREHITFFSRIDMLISEIFVKDFVKSDIVEGRTGFQFFCEYLPKLVLEPNESISRQQTIALFEKYKATLLLSKIVVLPAGMRDLEIDEAGRATSDEVNSLYFKLFAIANTINQSSVKASLESYNPQRMALQNTFNEIYDYFSKTVEGKKNLMMGKWASRKVFNTTRNVITSMNTESRTLGHKRNVGINSTLVGLYQTSKGLLPKTIYQLKTGFLDTVFNLPGSPALLTDPITLESKRVMLHSETYSEWLSNEGLEKQLTHFKEDSIRHEPIKVEGHYLGLCYRGPDGTFALINGIEQLPEGRSAKDCTPITLAELIYSAIYSIANNYSGYVTRYPITGIGSIYPSRVYLKTTVLSEERRELNTTTWMPLDDKHIAYEYPVIGSGFYNSLSPHPSALRGLGADFDGDNPVFN